MKINLKRNVKLNDKYKRKKENALEVKTVFRRYDSDK
jgi:hypothetical protein